MKYFLPLFLFVCAAANFVFAAPEGPPSVAEQYFPYEYVDLGLIGKSSAALGINEAGDAVGFTTVSWGQEVGLVYRGTDLAVNFGLSSEGFSQARAINASGDVVGASQPGVYTPYHAFLMRNGESAAMDLHPSELDFSSARAVNDFGEVVISGSTMNGATQSFVWDERLGYRGLPPTDVHSLSKAALASDISRSSVVVGTSSLHCPKHLSDTSVPTVWVPGITGEMISRALTFPGHGACGLQYDGFGEALAINSRNEIVGYTGSPADNLISRGTLWRMNREGKWEVEVGDLYTLFYDINSKGECVGVFRDSIGKTRGGLYNAKREWIAANKLAKIPSDLDSESIFLVAINDSGDLVGQVDRIVGGQRKTRAFLMRKRR
jgi:probable HAF family extracellular repeat protein